MERYFPIKSERSLRRHKAAGARFEYSGLSQFSAWYEDHDPYYTLRNHRETLRLRAVHKAEETEA